MLRAIAFLRAINVGGHTVKMETLRAIFESLGFSHVETFIASGNVIFDSDQASTPALEARIEERLRQALGYEVVTFIRTAPELAEIADYIPFPPAGPNLPVPSLYVSFLKEPLSEPARSGLLALQTETDQFHVHGREFYWSCQTHLSDSPLFTGTRLAKTIVVPTTLRNMTTIKKLAIKYRAVS